MLFSRASASHFLAWLKLPVGSLLSPTSLLPGSSSPILPKRSRLFTAAILLSTAVVLFLPQSREAISTVRASWNGYLGYDSDLRGLQNLAARAERENDARTLAFVSLVLAHSERATTFANHAVALGPALVWIYASSRVDGRPEFEPKEGLARLLESDRDNAVLELLAARIIFEPRYYALISHPPPSDQEIEAAVTTDPAWIAHMDRAFRAPRYDGYFDRHWQLTREVWNHHPELSASVIFNSLWVHSLPEVLSIRNYGNYLVHSAQRASDGGHAAEAETLLKRVDDFGRRMSEQGQADFGHVVGLSLSPQSHDPTTESLPNPG